MHGLYRPHRAQGVSRFGLAATVRCDPLMRQQLQRWRTMLASSGGVSARHAILRDEAASPPSLHIALCADACLGDPRRHRRLLPWSPLVLRRPP